MNRNPCALLPAIAMEQETIPLRHGLTHTRHPGDLLHPQREGRSALEGIKAEIGSLLFSSQYQQRPIPVEGNLIRREWFRYYDEPPSSRSGIRIVQSWDVAMTTGDHSDYSVGTTWLMDKKDYYLVDLFRARLEYPDLRRQIIGLARRHGASTILIEMAGPGLNLIQDLRADTIMDVARPIGVKPEGSKRDRMAIQSAKIEAGQVHLPRNAPWLGDFLHELLAFPNGRHDDQVDSVSQFLRWAQTSALFVTVDIGMPGVPRSCRARARSSHQRSERGRTPRDETPRRA